MGPLHLGLLKPPSVGLSPSACFITGFQHPTISIQTPPSPARLLLETMAEILGAVSGAFGLTTTVLHSIRVISSDIDSMKRAPQQISSLKRELRSVECLVQSLQVTLEAATETDDSQERVIVTALLACEASCENFRREFPKLLHPTDGDLSLVEKAKFGLWTKRKMVPFLADLSSCKSTVSLVLSGAN